MGNREPEPIVMTAEIGNSVEQATQRPVVSGVSVRQWGHTILNELPREWAYYHVARPPIQGEEAC